VDKLLAVGLQILDEHPQFRKLVGGLK